jgi:hypothetical protein
LKITYFTQFKVLSEEFNPQNTIVFLRLNSSSALNLNKLNNFQTASKEFPMKYAIVEGQNTEAQPKLKGTCSYCGSKMIARCGRHKIWHWAYKSRAGCDPWWKSEGEWYRNWKNSFPVEWQEVIHVSGSPGCP